MQKFYETVVIVDAMIPDEAIASEFEAIEHRISKKGKLHKVDKWKRRKLAYPIKGRSYGEYAVFYYDADSNFPSELERGFRINENILRWLTVAENPTGIPEDKPDETTEGNAEAKAENPGSHPPKVADENLKRDKADTPEKEGKE